MRSANDSCVGQVPVGPDCQVLQAHDLQKRMDWILPGEKGALCMNPNKRTQFAVSRRWIPAFAEMTPSSVYSAAVIGSSMQQQKRGFCPRQSQSRCCRLPPPNEPDSMDLAVP